MPDPEQYPYLFALHGILTASQWGDLFANRLAKRSAAQMLVKSEQRKATHGDLNRLTDTIAQEMRSFRPIKPRPAGAGLLI